MGSGAVAVLVNPRPLCYSGTVMSMAGETLVRRMAGGDRDAFGAFYDRYAPLVYPLIVRIVRDRSDAADVLQDVFWEAWQGAPAYDPARGTPEAWMITRARTRSIDRVRALRRRGETFVPPIDDEIAAAPAEAGGDAAERAEDRGIVRQALQALPPPQREAIELAYYGGLTQTEIAERLKQPLGTVKTRIRLGLERLREVVRRAP
jgi:RNA polymerase sigma-70 factor (ECF subfamily)